MTPIRQARCVVRPRARACLGLVLAAALGGTGAVHAAADAQLHGRGESLRA